ncbi:MAG: hypothetical protein LUD53_06370 [Clostridiales bacterium]|nr:hypothetical protein [Clostridiales bacterium]
MKKVSILVLDSEREEAMRKIRKLGLVHVDAQSYTSDKMTHLKDETAALEQAISLISDLADKKAMKKLEKTEMSSAEALSAARKVVAWGAEKKDCQNACISAKAELEQHESWGEINPADFEYLAGKGIVLSMYEISSKEYVSVDAEIRTLLVGHDKSKTYMLVVEDESSAEKPALPDSARRIQLPSASTQELTAQIEEGQKRIAELDDEIRGYMKYIPAMKDVLATDNKEIEFDAYLRGMEEAELSDLPENAPVLAILNGYVPEEDMDRLKAVAKENAWGIVSEDPTMEDNVPTKLHNNKFVSLIYPLTDFLGTVPGYYEQDISGYFLVFMLIFSGIIFGDGGYGALITLLGVAMFLPAIKSGKSPSAWSKLIILFGVVTIVWGILTCSWFGVDVALVPQWLQKISLPIISNVYEDTIWYPFWTNGEAGLTTAQNLQIFCFVLALIQLSIAHILGIIRDRRSLLVLSDIGSLMQVIGMFYVVLTLVVNGAVFGLDRVINGIPVGTISIVLVAVGFVMYFVFANYEGSIVKSLVESMKNIISMLLGIVNVFSDIVSYIRLWAVGLAGAAIAETFNQMAGGFTGHMILIFLAIFILIFGHGLNMILNLLSVIVHGVRLNTLEFSSHVGINWSGHKYEPFKE